MSPTTLWRITDVEPPLSKLAGNKRADQPLISPQNAWQLLRRRTGGTVGRSTFYRWLNSGRLYSIRLGFRIYIPLPALDNLIRQCMSGDRF
jgi:hypothetical protein